MGTEKDHDSDHNDNMGITDHHTLLLSSDVELLTSPSQSISRSRSTRRTAACTALVNYEFEFVIINCHK